MYSRCRPSFVAPEEGVLSREFSMSLSLSSLLGSDCYIQYFSTMYLFSVVPREGDDSEAHLSPYLL
jgi:hypothetical protein